MTKFSDYYENSIINHMLRGQAFSPPATVYLACFTSVAGLESNNPTGEVSGGGYVRQAVTLSAAANGATANSADISFPLSTLAWGTITHVALVDHLSNTTWGTNVNVLMWGELNIHKDIGVGDIFKILTGDLDITVD